MVAEPYYTNRDRFLHKLSAMSDKEFANIYCDNTKCCDCRFAYEKGCFSNLVEWFNQEIDNG